MKLLTKLNFNNYTKRILDLFRLRFTAPIKLEDLQWRYMQSPTDDLNAVIALDSDKVVGFIGTMPSIVKIKKDSVKAAMYTNIMTHPDYCGQGIFTQMAEKLEESLREKNYEFLYSFPNFQSNHLLIDRCGWTDIYEIPRMEVSTKEICGNFSKISESAVVQDNEFALDYSQIKPTVGGKGFERTTSYLIWRVKNNPTAIYDNFVLCSENTVDAYIIVRKYQNEYNIVDISFGSQDQAELLIAKVIKSFQEKQYRILTVWCPTNIELHSFYEKNGFTNNAPITYFAGKYIVEDSKKYDLVNWQDWFIHGIDDNIY
uniref:GNAT family N-acetyltransferase n=1 Tax=Tetragenococcus halophilus TaxID=51669 RepID=UPI0024E0D03D|nr:GNAT family N-acetyltransferase [Tetragenococcus halophilus]